MPRHSPFRIHLTRDERRELEHTVIYLHLSQRHLQAVANPLDAMPVSGIDTVRRTRRLHKR